MGTHDSRAELRGYQDELADAEANDRPEHAARVRTEIDRVSAELRAQAAALGSRADVLVAAGQDVAAAEARVQARALVEGLDEPAVETAVESTPLETATTPKRRRS